MKKLIYIACSFMIFLTTSCSKDSDATQVDNPEEKVSVGWSAKLSGNLMRAIEIRPRDEKTCACAACFGVCGMKFEITPVFTFLYDNSSTTTLLQTDDYPMIVTMNDEGDGTIYFVGGVPTWKEDEFIIDYDLVLLKSTYPSFPVAQLTVLSGEYDFVESSGRITLDGKDYNYSAYAHVDTYVIE